MIYQGKARYPVHEAVIHASDTRPDWMEGHSPKAKAAEIRRWHMEERGWRDIGYHRVIDRCGTVVVGRSLYEIGAHVRGHNRGTIGICLIGGHGADAEDRFEDHFTAAQRTALKEYLVDLGELTKLDKVSGHNEYALKACPGFHVRTREWLSV